MYADARVIFYSISTFSKNYYKHSKIYRAKTITKINGRNLTAICLANVSVRDCFLFFSVIVFLLLVFFSVSFSYSYFMMLCTKHSIISFIRFGSLLLFLLIELSDVFVCVRAMFLIWLMIYSLHAHSPSSQNTSYCSLIRWIFFQPFRHQPSLMCLYECMNFFRYQSRSTETSFVNFKHFSALFKECINGAHAIMWTLPLFS